MSNSSAAGYRSSHEYCAQRSTARGRKCHLDDQPAIQRAGNIARSRPPPTQTLSCTIGSNLSPVDFGASVHVASVNSSVGTYVNTATVTASQQRDRKLAPRPFKW